MDARIFGIGIYREDQDLIEFPFAIDSGMRSPRYTRPISEPNQLAVWCLTHRRAVFINDIEAEYDNYMREHVPGR